MKSIHQVVLAAATLVAASAVPAAGQTFVMNSAETINPGNFKVAGYPVVLMAEGDADDRWGGAGRLGLPLSRRVDLEATVGLFDGLTLFGADLEVWLIDGPVDLSVTGGGHLASREGGFGSKAVDLAGTVSGHATPTFELFGAITASFEYFDDIDRDITRTHFAPGVEIRLAQDLDLVAEVGLGLNDSSHDYAAFGLAYYVH